MRKKRIVITGITVLILLIFLLFFFRKKSRQKQIDYTVKKGNFEMVVNITGELKAEKSEDIKAPSGLMDIGLWNVKITDLIPEGTIVDSGSYVATLDRSEATNKLKTLESDLDKMESQYIKTKLDTSLDLRSARDELINLNYGVEEKKTILDQSKYEPRAVIRQAEIEFEKAKRAFDQANSNYQLKYKKAKAEMQDVNASLSQQTLKRDNLVEVLNKFVINAPKSGMIIYLKEWNGDKRKVGSSISPWNATVATLPDLSSMISRTFVNEIDISKVRIGQDVRLGVDAFPGKKFTGKVISIANIGEQLANSDAKVFEVLIKVNESDSVLRPAMTTSNAIITGTFQNVISIPLEAIHNNDSVSYVIKNDGGRKVRQIVIPGEVNENEVIIKKGLQEGDKVMLTTPENPEKLKWSGRELIPEIKKEKERKKSEEKLNTGKTKNKSIIKNSGTIHIN